MIATSVWNPKGGQGKSTVAVNLAAAAVDRGLSALVIDRDPQGTSMLFSQGGRLPFAVVGSYPDNAPTIDLVVIDHMAQDQQVPRAQRIVMPVMPKRAQYAAYRVARLNAEAQGKRVITVVINGDRRRTNERTLILALRNEGALEIRASGAFSRAEDDYRTIFDPELDRVYRINERRVEFHALLDEVMAEKEN